jgi:PAS domain S-box-containing protein
MFDARGSLPVTEGAAESPPDIPASPGLPARKKGLLKLILVGGDEAAAGRLIEAVAAGGWVCAWDLVETRQAFLDRLRGSVDLVIGDFSLPSFDGLAAVRLFREKDRVTPFLLVADRAAGPEAAEALRTGATEVVERERLDRLPLAVARALEEARVRAENRRLDQALRAAEQKLHSVFDQSLDVILIIQGATGTILRANRAAFLHLGYDEEALIGRHFSRLFPTGSLLAPGDLLDKLRVTGPVFESQPFLRADGTVCPMDITATLLPWGNAQAIVATLREASAREYLEETIGLVQFAVDRVGEIVFWSRPDGRLCRANRAACAALGYTQEELLALRLSDIEPGLGADLWPIHWEEVKNFGTFTLRAALRAKDGSSLPVDAQVHYLRHGDREYHCAIARRAADSGTAAA